LLARAFRRIPVSFNYLPWLQAASAGRIVPEWPTLTFR
jgi:hypothetical protein